MLRNHFSQSSRLTVSSFPSSRLSIFSPFNPASPQFLCLSSLSSSPLPNRIEPLFNPRLFFFLSLSPLSLSLSIFSPNFSISLSLSLLSLISILKLSSHLTHKQNLQILPLQISHTLRISGSQLKSSVEFTHSHRLCKSISFT